MLFRGKFKKRACSVEALVRSWALYGRGSQFYLGQNKVERTVLYFVKQWQMFMLIRTGSRFPLRDAHNALFGLCKGDFRMILWFMEE